MTIKILFPIALILFYRCASTPNEQYSALLSIPESQIITSLKDAVTAADVQELTIGDTLVSALSESHPVIRLGKSNPFRSNFKLYRFHGAENEVYTIEVISTCDSIHVDKNILYPLFILIDKEGNVIKQNKMALYETISSNLSTAFSIYGYQDIYTEQNGEYYLMVASDNSANTGNTISTVYREPMLKYKLQGINGKRSPWGRYRIIVRKK